MSGWHGIRIVAGSSVDQADRFAFQMRALDNLSEHIGNRMHLPALHLPYQSLGVILLIGLVAGWIAAKFMTKYGMGIVGDVIVGLIGAYIGNWLASRLGIHFGAGLVRTSLDATAGAIVLLLLICLIRRV